METSQIIVTVVLVAFALAVSVFTVIFKGGVKQWLKWAVATAEAILGGETGQLKLRYVYDMAVERFPMIKYIVPFKVFSAWVDEALVWLNEQIKNNPAIRNYVQPINEGLTARVIVK